MKQFIFSTVFISLCCLTSWSQVKGDINNDGTVDVDDLNAVINVMLGKSGHAVSGDVNGDNVTDIDDVNIIINIMIGKDKPTIPDEPNTYTANGVTFTMIPVKGGTFTMGSPSDQAGSPNETPDHQVTLSDYCIGMTEVTQELWMAVMGNNPSFCNGDGSNDEWWGTHYDFGTNLQRPVETITWNNCQEFITKLNQLTGMTFRLPTEAEWEYAALGGDKSQGYVYAGGSWIYDVAWFDVNCRQGTDYYGTHTVGTKTPNELGLYDMSGNVAEWCNDWYDGYSAEAQTDPTGPADRSPYFFGRVIRGGSWGSQESLCRVKSRKYEAPGARNGASASYGLRLAM